MSFRISTNSETESARLKQWIEGIQSGNQASAAELVQHYEPEVRRFIRIRLTDPRMRRLLDSVDICQSVMVRFFDRIQKGQISVEHPLQLMKLLTTMARNSILDHARKMKVRRDIHGSGDDLLLGVADPRSSPVELTERADLVAIIRSRLKTSEQQVLDRWLLGGGWDELSRDFACEPDALRKRLTRAIDRATQELGLLEDVDV